MRLALFTLLSTLALGLSACCNGGGGCLGSVALTVLTSDGAPAGVLHVRVDDGDQVLEVDCGGEIDTGAGPTDGIYCEGAGLVRIWTTEDSLEVELSAEEGSFTGSVEPAYTDIVVGKERCGVYCTTGTASISVEAA